MSETTTHKEVQLGRAGAAFAVIGVICIAITAIMAIGHGDTDAAKAATASTLQSYLFAVVMFMSLTLGCFGLSILQHVIQGKWGLPILRIWEAGGHIRNLALMAALFVPVLLGAHYLYPWARPDQVAHDSVLTQRAAYLNWPFLLARFALYFLIWGWYAYNMRKSVIRQEVTGKFREQQFRANFASPGLVLLVLSVTFAYTDWVMAIDPHWYSTMYGVWFVVGMALGAMSLGTLIICLNADREPYKQIMTPAMTRDFGNFTLTLIMLWGYTNLSQYLIIWNGNIPETTTYLVNRSLGHWSYLSFVLVVGQFFIPFFALLSPTNKAQPKRLAMIAAWILVMRVLDHFHVIEPFYRTEMSVNLADILSFLGVGGLWGALFCMNIKRHPLLPTYDARLLETPEHAH